MYRSPGCLPHLLPPSAYFSSEQHQLDLERLLSCWHLVGTTDELSRHGDFLTCELLGHPVQVRNFKGRLHALSNVCVHRHCLLTDKANGNSPHMRCQYHGWEYASTGRPCKIPAPQNFLPFPRDTLQLPGYDLDCAGKLIFIRLASGPSLAEQLGPLHAECHSRFGDGWRAYLSFRPDYLANWKVPVENSLEAYHVPCVHPHTFGQDPGEQRSQHEFSHGGSSFATGLPFAHTRLDGVFQRCEGWVVRQLGGEVADRYRQYHVFPNLLFSFTDAICFVQCVLPTAPNRCRALVYQFSRSGKGLAWGWGRLKGAITRKILEEDLGLFASIQKGLEGSSQRGLLGRCEERIHAFHEYLSRERSQA